MEVYYNLFVWLNERYHPKSEAIAIALEMAINGNRPLEAFILKVFQGFDEGPPPPVLENRKALSLSDRL
jgi:hypothetical protein